MSSLLGGGAAAAVVRDVRLLPALPAGAVALRSLLAAPAPETAPAPAIGGNSGGAGVALERVAAAGGHLESRWRLTVGGEEVAFGQHADSKAANFLQYEAPTAAGAHPSLSMASMGASASAEATVAAANVAAGQPASTAGAQPHTAAAANAAPGQPAHVQPQMAAAANAAAGQPAHVQPHSPAVMQVGCQGRLCWLAGRDAELRRPRNFMCRLY